MLVPNARHIGREGGIAEVGLIIDIGAVSVRTVYHSSWLAELHWSSLYSLQILSIEASISTRWVACSAFNKNKPIGVINNSFSDSFCCLIKISIQVASIPSSLERFILDINGKNVPSILVSLYQSSPSLDHQCLTMSGIIPQTIRGECVRLEGMEIQENYNSISSHIVDYFVHHLQGFQTFEVQVAIFIVGTITILNRSRIRVVQDQIQRERDSHGIKLIFSQKINDELIINCPEPMYG